MTPDDDELSAADRDALERALALAKAERPEQIGRMLSEDPWMEAASFAAYHCQIRALQLKPWQSPPCYGHLDGDTGATILLKRLLDAGLSRWEPDPVGVLAALEARPPTA
jgi:hypothetical protein